MKHYSKLYGFVGAFFSPAVYRDAGLYWRGAGVGNLVLLVFICALATAVDMHVGFNTFVRTEAPKVINQVPPIAIKDGEVSCDAPQPCYIKDPSGTTTIAIIDTSGSIQSLDDTDARLLLTKTQIIAKKNAYETQMWSLAEVKEFDLTSERIMGWLRICGMVLAPVVGVFLAIFSFVFRILQVLVYAGVGMAMSALVGARITYAGAMRITVLAITPAMVVRTALTIAKILPPYAWILFFIVAMVYLFIGMMACARPVAEEPPVTLPEPVEPTPAP